MAQSNTSKDGAAPEIFGADNWELLDRSVGEGVVVTTEAMFVGHGCLVRSLAAQADGKHQVALAFVPGASQPVQVRDENQDLIGRKLLSTG